MKFISRVEQDISLVHFTRSWDILVDTQNSKFMMGRREHSPKLKYIIAGLEWAEFHGFEEAHILNRAVAKIFQNLAVSVFSCSRNLLLVFLKFYGNTEYSSYFRNIQLSYVNLDKSVKLLFFFYVKIISN